ncbi:[LysW]-lysine hydrolase [Salinigranum salinum]|uniref:[LysW]-lysine hydrolase n=1 Tax=Salinigranum salinum TaxID=1364937 RepID=UPI00126110F8|nr:[LysW]-lysine hydrolase [Salinigranum salinum]
MTGDPTTTTAIRTPRALLEALVATPSVSGEEDAAAALLVDYFAAHDREAFVDEVGNVHAPGDDAVLLTSHVDTVPGDVPVRVEDGVLWGRGAVDAKGPLCAMAVAAVRTGVSFVGVVGEEYDSRGARHLLETRTQPRALINGEPSGWDAVTLGYRGLLAGTYVGTSPSGHASRPEPNAIEEAIDWWGRIEVAFSTDRWATVTERVTAKPLRFSGGLTDDGIAVEATVDVQFRVPLDADAGAVRDTVESQLGDGGAGEASITWKDAVPPVLVDRRGPLPAAFRRHIRAQGGDPRLLVKTGTSDMNLYADAWDCPMVTYGPGNSDLDHTPDERIALAEYDRSIAILEAVCETLVV